VSFETALAAAEGVEGWLSDGQARRLFERAAAVPPAGRIVEIGSYRGRSAIVLARALGGAGVELVAIDPHAGNDRGPQEIHGSMAEGEADNCAFRENLERAGVVDAVLHDAPDVERVRCDENRGAAGRNAGVARVHTPYVAFCDDDTWWAAGALAHACDLLDEHRHIGYGTWFLREKCVDPRLAQRVVDKLLVLLPLAITVLVPEGVDPFARWTLLGSTSAEINEFGFRSIRRRLNIIGVRLPSGWTRGLRRARPDWRVLYVTSEDFTNRFVQAMRLGKLGGFRRHFRECDALLVDQISRSDTYPYVDIREDDVSMGHEATVSKVSDDQLFYCLARGIAEEDAVNMIVSGFCKSVFRELPMEFAVEAQALLAVSLEGAVG